MLVGRVDLKLLVGAKSSMSVYGNSISLGDLPASAAHNLFRRILPRRFIPSNSIAQAGLAARKMSRCKLRELQIYLFEISFLQQRLAITRTRSDQCYAHA